jgi:hypothetical protein
MYFFLNRAVYGIMWKNLVQPGRLHMTTWRTHIVCWVPTATNTHNGRVILIALPLHQWLHERASLLSDMRCLSSYIVLCYRFIRYRQLMAYYWPVTLCCAIDVFDIGSLWLTMGLLHCAVLSIYSISAAYGLPSQTFR